MYVGAISALLKIVAINLVLSGDNAVVIGMAARRLPAHQRRMAIVWGGAGAVGLRIVFTILAALLLGVPLLQALGGVLLVWIAVRLLRPFAGGHSSTREADTMGAAIRTIILADAVMSLDNMLAVGGASKGHIWLLLFGLGMSIPIVLIGGGIVSILIERFPWLSYVGAAVLVHIAIEMIFGDSIVEEFLTVSRRTELLTVAVAVLAVTAFGWVSNRRYQRRNAQSAADAEAEQPARPVSREKVLTHE